MTEEQFRCHVRKIAALRGWTLTYHTHNSRRSDAGWPDEVYGHPKAKRTIFAEFKSNTGRIRPAQRDWLQHLRACGFETALWRPTDLDHIVAVLAPDGPRAELPETF
ncbi:VRR-NUC domain-containing protein [Streptomyces venezuelae]|uniref:VRR-NUC domain-containing protein n=1 Tax=Streptomyces venezuelae TaxID=54571 RepID=A0A5P2C6I2_STRVZ|nr:VRR-NUC domain-containing protein [Streptomyces venezuelae]QES38262.1 VRR-NUC domain-containing protein [Streptomyces venezuelae]